MNPDDSNDMNRDPRSNDARACDAFAEDLSHFVLDELDEARRPALEQHLVDCASCRAERDLLARSVERLKADAGAAAPILELSVERRAELLNQAAANTGLRVVPTRRWTMPRFAAAAAVVATAGLVGLQWWKQRCVCDDGPVLSRGLLAARRVRPDGAAEAPTSSDSAELRRLGYIGGDGGADESIDAGVEEMDGYGFTVPAEPSPANDPSASATGSVAPAMQPTREFSALPQDLAPGDLQENVLTLAQPAAQTPSASTAPETIPAAAPPGPGGPTTARERKGARIANVHLTPEELRVMTKQRNREALTPEETNVLRQARRNARDANGAKNLGVAKSDGRLATGGGDAKPTEGAPAKDETELTEAELSSLEQLGYFGDGGGGTDDAEKTTSLNEELLRGIKEPGGLPPPPPVGGMGASQSLLFDDSNATISGFTTNFFANPVEPVALARSLADSLAPSEIIALQPQLVGALGFDPSMPTDADSGRHTDEVIREFLSQLSPRQGETPRDMFFRYFGDHPFVSTRIDPMSTFGMDVDTASYNLVRAYLTKGNLPPKAAVRTEEFVNAFRHDLAPPSEDGAEVFAIHTELAPSPFGDANQVMLQVGLKARAISKAKRRPVALTFVIDVSGSMEEGGRLELVKRSLSRLVDQLDERDTIGIVSFSTDARRVLDPTNAARRGQILTTLERLRPDGSTNADAGLRLGYDMALEQLRSNAENRVILCSDGVANTGITDAGTLVQRIRECKTKYLYLNCVGVGMNNHNDALLEQLADEGDGFCAYVDRDEEAKEIFVDKLSGTLMTVARNAKIQVEFDEHAVRRFRQLGYENRALAHRDFRNDKVDAGEVGAGHEVIALYELELQNGAVGPLATVRCRYEEPQSGEVIEQARPVFVAEQHASVRDATPRFRLSMAVAEFAEILRQSIHARSGSLADVQRFAEPLVAELPGDDDVPEFVALVKQAARLPDLLPQRTELVRAVDEIKRYRCFREEMRSLPRTGDTAKDAANDELMRQLEEQNRKLEQALRDALERAARGS